MAASEDIGTRQTFERQVGAIGTTANGLHLGLDASVAHSLLSTLHHIEHRLHHLAHVVVLIFNLAADTTRVFDVQKFHNLLNQLLFLLEFLAIMVTDNVSELGILHSTFHVYQQEETLIILGILRSFKFRQQSIELHGNQLGIHHLSLSIAGMNVPSLNIDASGSGVEVLIFQLTDSTTIHGIGKIAAEFFHIEMRHALANFLIRRETDTNLAMLDFRMLHQVFHSTYYLSDTGFIVGTKQSFAVGGQQGLSLIVAQFREIHQGQCSIAFGIQHDVATIVILDDSRSSDTRHIGSGVKMGNETNYGLLLFAVGWQGGSYITILVFFNFL